MTTSQRATCATPDAPQSGSAGFHSSPCVAPAQHAPASTALHAAAAAPASRAGRPPWLGLAVLLLGGFVTIFDLFVVNVAIPDMRDSLGASFAQIGFVVAGYELAFGLLLITGGRLGDIFGRRRLFLWGMAGFGLASALCGLAPTAELLIGARVLQGLAAALLFPQIYASIRVSFPGAAGRRAFGLLGMTLGLAAIAGQVLGGWLVHADLAGLGWRSIFLLNLPVCALAMAVASRIPESRSAVAPGLDGRGVVLASTGLALLLVPLLEGPAQGWPGWTLASLAGAVLMLALFVRHESGLGARGGQPLVDMPLMRQSRFALGAGLVLLVYSTSSAFFLCFALLVQTGFGLNPFEAGSLFAPCSVGFVVASLAAPRAVARFGVAALVVGGAVYCVSLAGLTGQVAWAGSALSPWALMPILVVVGAAQGFIMTPLLNLVLGFVPEEQAGMAAGVISTLQQVGAALGVSAVGMLFTGTLAQAPDAETAARYAAAFSMGMLYNVAAALAACGLLEGLRRVRRREGAMLADEGAR